MTIRNILLLAILISFGLLLQYFYGFSQQKAEKIGTDVVVVNKESFDPSILNKYLEQEKETLTTEKLLAKNSKKDEVNHKNNNRGSNPKVTDGFEEIIVGRDLKVGMRLKKAILILGIPKSLKIKRGIEPNLDSMSIEYLDHGITIYIQNGEKRIKTIKVSQQFKGEFEKGIKIGERVSNLIDKLGTPKSINPSIARYPKKGIHFTLNKNSVVGAHVFKKQ
jgi:hypothetical protein